MTTVIVLAGGRSDERAVSIRSGCAVASALKQAGHSVELLDPEESLQLLLPNLMAADVIFPALHGIGGEDGSLQHFLEEHAVPFVGSGSKASEVCFDKAGYIQLLQNNHILTPQTELVNYDQYRSSSLAQKPFVLKPNDGGSSLDTFIIRDVSLINTDAIETAFKQYRELLLQELIVGTEITVGVLGTEALPVIEIIPPAEQEFDYENKYNGATQELCPPQTVSEELQSQAQALAVKIHELTACRDMSRTDIMISETGELYVLETNTIPGLTEQSLLPKAAATAGISMPNMCDQLVKAALSRVT